MAFLPLTQMLLEAQADSLGLGKHQFRLKHFGRRIEVPFYERLCGGFKY